MKIFILLLFSFLISFTVEFLKNHNCDQKTINYCLILGMFLSLYGLFECILNILN